MKRISQLPQLTAPAADDLLAIVDQSTGLTKYITYRDLVNIPELGWTSGGETWVYASATTFTVAGVDVREKYPIGTKIRLKQGGSYKYFYVVATSFSTNTTITVYAGSDYSLANSTITDNYFSYAVVATGFPKGFNFTPSWTALVVGTGGSAANLGFMTMNGSRVSGFTQTVLGSSGASVSGSPFYSLPVTPNALYNSVYNWQIGNFWMTDAGVQQYGGSNNLNGSGAGKAGAVVEIVNGGAYKIMSGMTSSAPFSWGASDNLQSTFEYIV